jgi:hypothetical protein
MLLCSFALAKRHVSQSLPNHVSRPDRRSRRSRPSHVCATMRGKSRTRCRDPHLVGLYVANSLVRQSFCTHIIPRFSPISSLYPPINSYIVLLSHLFCYIGLETFSLTPPPAAYCTYLPRFLFPPHIDISFILCLLPQASYTVATTSWIESIQSICPPFPFGA